MKKRPIVLLIILSIIITTIHAQNISLGVRGGLTIPNLTGGGGTPLSEGYSTRAALGFGVFAEFKVSRLFSIEPVLEYSQQGAKKNGMQAFPYDPSQLPDPRLNDVIIAENGGTQPQYLYADYKSTAKLNYLMLPILAKFGWDLGKQSHWRLYADVGPYAGLLLNAHQVQTGGQQQVYLDKEKKQPITFTDPQDPTSSYAMEGSFDTTANIKDDIHKGNFGIEGNVGIAYKFKRSSIFIEGGGNYGLLNIQKYAEYGKNHSGAATVMIGYSITL